MSDGKDLDLFDWHEIPSWAQEGGEHFDGHWVPDCQGKMDYDPGLLRISCRTYPTGGYSCAIIFGDDTVLEETGHIVASNQTEARAKVEAWAKERALHYRRVVMEGVRLDAHS